MCNRHKLLLAIATLLVFSANCYPAAHTHPDETDVATQICDPIADYYLGVEDYPAAIRRHLKVIQKHPDRALAYYHLGFAYGVIGDRAQELTNYQKAVELGLSDWELFLNLGRLYLENNQLDQATNAFRLAVLMAPYRPETHYNLGLAYERLGNLTKAEQEILLSLRLKPDQVEARNTLAVILAEEGNFPGAREEWGALSKSYPDYQPALANLAILKRIEHDAARSGTHMSSFNVAP